MQIKRSFIIGPKFDDLFVFFPFWFPLIYIALVVNFPFLAPYLFLTVLFLFAETHFGSTWLFFFDKENKSWIKKNSYNVFFIPIYTLVIVFFIWNINLNLVIIFHYLASGWHVTKQSVGILTLANVRLKFNSLLIYITSFTCLAIGLYRPGLLRNQFNNIELNLLIIIFSIIYILCIKYSNYSTNNFSLNSFLPLITGTAIYLPLLFFNDLAAATAIGVGMHWCQYIALTWSINIRKKTKIFKINNGFKIFKNSLRSLLFVFGYSLIMTLMAYLGTTKIPNQREAYNIFYLIPILFQLYHFYIDGFIWKFSDPHIKKSIAPYIFNK